LALCARRRSAALPSRQPHKPNRGLGKQSGQGPTNNAWALNLMNPPVA
jgi:hypothetical protein